jgi:hypothetical protein
MWMLFVILLNAEGYNTMFMGLQPSMEVCFQERDRILSTAPKPKINYEVVCVQTDITGI